MARAPISFALQPDFRLRMHDDPIARRAHQLLPVFLATCMSAFVAAMVTAINTGADAGLAARWWHAWLRAWPCAVAAAYLFRPLAGAAALRVARWTTRAGIGIADEAG